MPTQSIIITPGELPNPYCFTDWQRLNVDIISRLTGRIIFSTGVGWNFGAATPVMEQRVLPWLNTGNGRVYTWSDHYGYWISPVAPSLRIAGYRMIWKPVGGQVEADVWSLDEGDGTDPNTTPPTAVSGAMWQVDHDFDGRAPFGIGPVPGTSNPALTIGVAGSGGEGQHALIGDENGPHTHKPFDANSSGFIVDVPAGGQGTNVGGGLEEVNATTGSSGLGLPHNNMPPYWGAYFLKPTARVYYRIPG